MIMCINYVHYYLSGECTFEDADLCGWAIKNNGAVDWKRMTGHTAGKQGPQIDHTYGTPNGEHVSAFHCCIVIHVCMHSMHVCACVHASICACVCMHMHA